MSELYLSHKGQEVEIHGYDTGEKMMELYETDQRLRGFNLDTAKGPVYNAIVKETKAHVELALGELNFMIRI